MLHGVLIAVVVLVHIDDTTCPHYAGRGTAKRRKLEENAKLEKWLVSHSEVSGCVSFDQRWMFYNIDIDKLCMFESDLEPPAPAPAHRPHR